MAGPRVEVSIGITLNVGNYESVRAEARYGKEGPNVTWESVVEEAEAGLNAALGGVERMLSDRKTRKKEVAPLSGTPRHGKLR